MISLSLSDTFSSSVTSFSIAEVSSSSSFDSSSCSTIEISSSFSSLVSSSFSSSELSFESTSISAVSLVDSWSISSISSLLSIESPSIVSLIDSFSISSISSLSIESPSISVVSSVKSFSISSEFSTESSSNVSLALSRETTVCSFSMDLTSKEPISFSKSSSYVSFFIEFSSKESFSCCKSFDSSEFVVEFSSVMSLWSMSIWEEVSFSIGSNFMFALGFECLFFMWILKLCLLVVAYSQDLHLKVSLLVSWIRKLWYCLDGKDGKTSSQKSHGYSPCILFLCFPRLYVSLKVESQRSHLTSLILSWTVLLWLLRLLAVENLFEQVLHLNFSSPSFSFSVTMSSVFSVTSSSAISCSLAMESSVWSFWIEFSSKVSFLFWESLDASEFSVELIDVS